MSIESESVRGKRRVVVISDLHMGVNERKIFSSTDALAQFIEHIADEHDAQKHSTPIPVELVILGDAVDFLQFDNGLVFESDAALQKITQIINTHAAVFTALAGFVSQEHRTVRWFVGNHDLELVFASVRKAIEKAVGVNEGQRNFYWHLSGEKFDYVLGNGARIRLIHGNQPDPWNAIDYAQAQRYADGDRSVAFDYCPGSKLVVEVLNPLADRGFFHVSLLKPEQSVALPLTFALWPSDTKELLEKAFPLLEEANHRTLKERVKDWFSTDRTARPIGTEELLLDLIATVTDDVEDHAIELLDDLVGHSSVISSLIAHFTGQTAAKHLEDKARKIATRLLDRAAREANEKSDPWAIDTRDDLWQEVSSTFAGENPDNVAILIAGHTHLARALQLPAGYYINTGTWANLMRLPRELDRLAFDAWAGSLRDFFEHPERAPWALRPFARLTYADVTLNDDKAPYTAQLCEWPNTTRRTLMEFP